MVKEVTLIRRNQTYVDADNHTYGLVGSLTSTFSVVLMKLIKNRLKLMTLLVLSLPVWYWQSSTTFYQAWFSKDQQAALYFEQGEFKQAAQLFEEPQWKAYSTYLSGDFVTAIELLGALDNDKAQFALANAYAHSMQFDQALTIYEFMKNKPEFESIATNNITVIQMAIEKIKNSPPEKQGNEKVLDDRQIVNDNDQEGESNSVVVSDQLWLKQVRQNPSKFLRQKFQQEYANEHL